MKIIFLDIDGVLNTVYSSSRVLSCVIGVDNDKVKRLKKIVDKTGAEIVLCSSWKGAWSRYYKSEQRVLGNYLDEELGKENLIIFDKTTDCGFNRGEGIVDYVKEYNVENWIVIDDEIFCDYEKLGIFNHLIKTDLESENGGLQDNHIEEAIRLLND